MLTSRDIIPEPEATVVADVLQTVAELRRASATLASLKRRDGDKMTAAAFEKIGRSEAYVRELTERVESRARSADMDVDELIALAGRVIDGKRRLPEGVSALETA